MVEARVERRLAAILAADVAGYSRLMGNDEEACGGLPCRARPDRASRYRAKPLQPEKILRPVKRSWPFPSANVSIARGEMQCPRTS